MNQIMTDYQRELVIEHLGLIDQVIRKRIRVRGTPLLSYEDGDVTLEVDAAPVTFEKKEVALTRLYPRF